MEYLNYVKHEGRWYPPIEANVVEIVFMVVAAGRSDIRFRLSNSMPYTYSLFLGMEDMYQRKTGLYQHTDHSFSDEQYTRVCKELRAVLDNDPCNRNFLKNDQI